MKPFKRAICSVTVLFDTSSSYLLRDSFWLGAYHVVASALLVVLVLLFGRLLPRSVYGEYSFLLSVGEVLGALLLTGLSTAIIQSVAREHDGIVKAALKEVWRWSVVPLIVCVGLAAYYLLDHNIVYAAAFVIIALTLPVYRSASLSDYLLIGRKNYKASSLYNSFANIALTAAMIVALVLHASLLALVATYFIARTSIELALYLWTVHKYPPRNDEVEKESMPYAYALSAFGLLTTFADQADALFMFYLLGPASLALYSFAVAAPELIKGAVKNQLTALALPAFSNHSREDIRTHLLPSMALCVLLSVPVVVLYIFAAPYLFDIFLPAYRDAVFYSQLFSISFILVPAATLPITALRSQTSEQKLYYRFLVIAEVLQIVFLLIGIKWFGIMGAIGAYFCARLFRLVYASYLVWRGE